VPAGEHDLVSGKKAKKTATLRLTSRAKSPKKLTGKAANEALYRAAPELRPLTAKEQVRETLREVRAAHQAAHEKRMDACAAAAETAPAEAPAQDSLASCQVEIRKVAGLWGEAVIRAGKNIGVVGAEKVAGDRRWVARQAYETVEETTASIVVTFGDTKEQAVGRFAAAWARQNSE
jgi:hypothetical protein